MNWDVHETVEDALYGAGDWIVYRDVFVALQKDVFRDGCRALYEVMAEAKYEEPLPAGLGLYLEGVA